MPIPVSQIIQSSFAVSGNYVSYNRQNATLSGVRNVRANLFDGSQPRLFYDGDVVSGVYYVDGSYKQFSYSGGLLTQTNHYMSDSRVYTKNFVYLNNGSLSGVIESIS